jgi:hypothetical protein
LSSETKKRPGYEVPPAAFNVMTETRVMQRNRRPPSRARRILLFGQRHDTGRTRDDRDSTAHDYGSRNARRASAGTTSCTGRSRCRGGRRRHGCRSSLANNRFARRRRLDRTVSIDNICATIFDGANHIACVANGRPCYILEWSTGAAQLNLPLNVGHICSQNSLADQTGHCRHNSRQQKTTIKTHRLPPNNTTLLNFWGH